MTFLVFLLGLCVGSFLNAYIWRLHMQEALPPGARRQGLHLSAWRGRSYCPKCRKPLKWYELIPLVSFAAQLGRCRGCREKIDWQYPAVEIVTAILFVASYELGIRNYGMIPNSLFLIRQVVSWYIFSVLIVLFVYDLRYGLVPDRVVLPAIAVALAYSIFAHSHEWENVILGFVVSTLFFAAQYALSRGRWIGAGDIRLGALMGAVAGWPLVIVALAISYILGGLVSVALLATGRKRFGETVPLGTFLTAGTAITMLYGQDIVSWYVRLL